MGEERKTVLMVTHDVDEALLLADRIVMMTNGPAATVGEILTVPFTRPRDRFETLDDPIYARRVAQLLHVSRRACWPEQTEAIGLNESKRERSRQRQKSCSSSKSTPVSIASGASYPVQAAGLGYLRRHWHKALG